MLKRRLEEKLGANQPKNQSICQEITDILWDRFHEIHNGQVKMEREITMENLKKYQEIFMDIFHVDADVLNESFTFQDQNDWDSLVHLTLISTLEDEFVIMFETDDILHFGGYENGIRILRKYGVDI